MDYLNSIPATMPPAGVIPDLASTYNNLEAVSIFTWTICALAVVSCVTLRSFTRFYIIRKVGFADYLPILACIGALVYISLSIVNETIGAGKHTWNVSAAKAMQLAYWANITAAAYAPAILLAKSAVIIPLIATFTPTQKTWLYWAYVTLLALNVGFWFSGMFAVLFACSPREKIWNPLVPGTCTNQSVIWIFSSAWNIFTDFWIIILPLFSIYQLRVAIKYKIGITIMFLMTIFALVASIIRLYYTVKLTSTADVVYVEAQLGLWTIAEMVALICCSCLPVFPRLYHWLRGKNVNSTAPMKSDYIEFAHSRKQQSSSLGHIRLDTDIETREQDDTQVLVPNEPRSLHFKQPGGKYGYAVDVRAHRGS